MGQQPQPRRNEPGGQPPANRDNDRERDRNVSRDNDRGANRDARADSDGAATSRPAAAARQGGKKPVNKLNMYMRGVAVLALLIVGGLGVYKGRAMLNAKETGPKVAQVKEGDKPEQAKPAETKSGEKKPGEIKPAAAKPVDPGKAVSSTFAPNVNSTKPGEKPSDPKKPGTLLPSLNNKPSKPAVTDKNPASTDKKPGLSGFKFGGKKDDKAKPAVVGPPSNGSGYSLNDTDPAAADDEGYSAAPPAAPRVGDYGGYSAAAPITTPEENGGGYSGTSPKKPTPRVGLNVADVAEGPAYSAADSDPMSDGYGAGEPIPTAPPYGSTGDDGYSASPAAKPAATTSPASSRPPKFAGLGSPPKNPLPKKNTTTPAASNSAKPGSLSDQDPAADVAAISPAKTVPPNRLATNPLETTLPARSAPTAGRYAEETTDVTPIGTPGAAVEPQMIGQQTPSIAVEKFAPEEVQVGKPATFEIVVKNVGKVPAYDVTVIDEVPRGTRFRQATPQPSQTKTGGLSWKLGVMKPGEERVIELQLVPEMEGEIGSVAQVSFQAQAGSKSIVTQPKLEIRHDAPQQVHAGEAATVRLTITNAGTGAASNLVLVSDVPDGFTHEAGRSLETKMNPLRPGESTQINLVMKAVKAGQYEQAFAIEEDDGKVVAQDAARIEVVAPGLNVAVAGPKKRYVERQATHAITIANPGTASAKDVDLIAYLPRGFKFVSATPAEAGGQYNAAQHAVVWGIEELVAGAKATVQLTTLPIEAGDQKVRVEARSANGLTADFEQLVAVDAVSELPFTIHDLADPIEIGSETAYEIRLSNRGAKDATNVAISIAFPPELKPLEGEGAARATVTAQRVDFAPIGRIAPGSEVVVKVRAEGLRAGDHRIAVSLTTDEQQQPITREESTRVYEDQ